MREKGQEIASRNHRKLRTCHGGRVCFPVGGAKTGVAIRNSASTVLIVLSGAWIVVNKLRRQQGESAQIQAQRENQEQLSETDRRRNKRQSSKIKTSTLLKFRLGPHNPRQVPSQALLRPSLWLSLSVVSEAQRWPNANSLHSF